MKATISWSRAVFMSVLHCCKVQIKILAKKSQKGERTPVVLFPHFSKNTGLQGGTKIVQRSVVNPEQQQQQKKSYGTVQYIYSIRSLKADSSTADSKTYNFTARLLS